MITAAELIVLGCRSSVKERHISAAFLEIIAHRERANFLCISLTSGPVSMTERSAAFDVGVDPTRTSGDG